MTAPPADATPSASRSGHLHKLVPGSPYEKIYGVKIRAVKRWLAVGRHRRPVDPAPIDEPGKMRAWWIRNMKQRVPDRIEELAAQSERVASSAGGDKREAEDPAPLPVPVVEVGRGGFLDTLERLRAAEAEAGAVYLGWLKQAREQAQRGEEVLAARSEAQAEIARRAWEKFTKELRSYEKDAKAILEATGEAWPRPAVLKAMTEIHSSIAEGVRGLLRRVRPKLRGLSDVDQDAVWTKETEALFEQLRRDRFTAPSLRAD